MRAREFIREFTINVPVTVNIPLSDVLAKVNDEKVINPGVRYNNNGDAKWSPPLQQHLDTVKDSVGPTTEDPTVISPDDEFHTPAQELDSAVKSSDNTIPTVSIRPSILG